MLRFIRKAMQNTQKALTTDFKRKFKNSGQLFLDNTSIIASNEIYVFTLDKRFIPYDDILLVNLNNDNDCLVTINNSHKSPLPRGESVIPLGRNVTDIRVQNTGVSNISANEIQLFYEHTGAEGQRIIEGASSALGLASSLKIIKGKF